MDNQQSKLVKAVFHIHTHFSPDASIKPEKLVNKCLKNGIKTIAITDHNTIKGGVETAKLGQIKVIVGEEIQTREGGEIIGLFLTKEISKNTPVLDAIKEIKHQGGLVYLPHPFDKIRKRQFAEKELEKISGFVDVVETYNGRNIQNTANLKADEYAEKYQKLKCAGADAHFLFELKNASVVLPAFDNSSELMESFKKATLNKSGRVPILAHVLTAFLKRTNGR